MDDFFRPVEDFALHGVSFSEPGVDFLARPVEIVLIGDQFVPGGADFDDVVEEKTAPQADLAPPGTPFVVRGGDFVPSDVEYVAPATAKDVPSVDFFVPALAFVLARGT